MVDGSMPGSPELARAAIASTAARASTRAVPASPVETSRGAFAIASAFAFSAAMTSSISLRACRTCVFSSSFRRRLNVSSRWCSAASRCCMRASASFKRLAFAGGQAPLVLERSHVMVDLGKMIGELRLARAEVFTRGGDHRLVQAEPTGDFERQTPPGASVRQLVGRLERRQIETKGGARHTAGRGGVRLQLIVVARGDHRGAAAAEVIHDRHSQRASFNRIGAGSHLVEQHQRRRRQSRSIDAMFLMCAENVLRLASIDCSSPMSANSERNTGSREPSLRRNAQPGLSHQRQQSGRLQRDRLAAGVRPGDEQYGRRRNHLDRHRNRIFQQRVPRRLQLERAVVRQRGFDPVNRFGEARAGLEDVELGRRRRSFGPCRRRVGGMHP